jgi:hypothetical protein
VCGRRLVYVCVLSAVVSTLYATVLPLGLDLNPPRLPMPRGILPPNTFVWPGIMPRPFGVSSTESSNLTTPSSTTSSSSSLTLLVSCSTHSFILHLAIPYTPSPLSSFRPSSILLATHVDILNSIVDQFHHISFVPDCRSPASSTLHAFQHGDPSRACHLCGVAVLLRAVSRCVLHHGLISEVCCGARTVVHPVPMSLS